MQTIQSQNPAPYSVNPTADEDSVIARPAYRAPVKRGFLARLFALIF